MEYDAESDLFICQNGKKLKMSGTKFVKSKTGYKSKKQFIYVRIVVTVLTRTNVLKGIILKYHQKKELKNLNLQKSLIGKEDLTRIITDEGSLLRMNRSIQAEGSFAQLKHDMNFRRFMCRGQNNVLAESILLAVAHNINKLHNKIQTNRTGKHLFELKKTT